MPNRSSEPGRCDLLDAFGQGDVGGQRVDPDAVRGQLEGRGLGVVDDTCLGCRIGCVTRCGADAFDRRDADDAAGQLLLDEAAGHPLGAQVTWRRLDLYSASQPFSVVSRIPDQKTPPALLTRIVTGPSSARSARARRPPRRCPGRRWGCRARRSPRRRTRTTRGCAPRSPPWRRMPSARRDAAADACAPAGDDRDAVGQQNVGRIDCHGSEYRTIAFQGLQFSLYLLDL